MKSWRPFAVASLSLVAVAVGCSASSGGDGNLAATNSADASGSEDEGGEDARANGDAGKDGGKKDARADAPAADTNVPTDPAGTSCASAIDITSAIKTNGAYSGQATVTGNDPSSCSSAVGAHLLYLTWTPPAAGNYRFTITGQAGNPATPDASFSLR